MKTKIKFKDGIEIEQCAEELFEDVVSSLEVDISAVPQFKSLVITDDFVKSVVENGISDSVIDGMYSISGESREFSYDWIVSVGKVRDVTYEDVVNSGYHFKYFTTADGTVYVLFSCVEEVL